MNLRTDKYRIFWIFINFKHLKNKELNTVRPATGVGLTLVKLCIIFLAMAPLRGQYLELRSRQEVGMAVGLSLHTGVNMLAEYNHWGGPVRTWQVPVLDAAAQYKYAPTAAKISDAAAIGTAMAAGMLTLALPENQRLQYLTVGVQNVWMTANLTQTVKVLAARNRPYTQAPGFVSGSRDDHYSFFSGHSSITATVATTALMVALNQQNVGAWGRPAAYAAGGLALTSATLRIAAGKHYPSDVVTGILVGAGVALINTQLHRVK
jgi:membrane-associated phospholipid phosphatase